MGRKRTPGSSADGATLPQRGHRASHRPRARRCGWVDGFCLLPRACPDARARPASRMHYRHGTMALMFEEKRSTRRGTTRAHVGDSLDLPRAREVLEGRYLVHGVIGEGGMAIVFSATHLKLDLPVAIKLLRPEGREYPDVVERFLDEGQAAARIRSEHVARVFDVGEGPYGPYLVMEHLQGRDLENVIRRDGPLSVDRAVGYVLQACEAIAEAHAAGVIHRDIKPANLFLSLRPDGSECVKVLDFGISKLTPRGPGAPPARATDPALFMGSPPYVSPEQAKSPRDVDARTDVWALGATLYELLAGEPPFGLGPSAALLLRASTRRPPPLAGRRADVPVALDRAIARSLAVDLGARYATVAELASAIAECGASSARASAGRIARISDPDGWEVSTSRRRRDERPLRAMDILEPRRMEREMGGSARWGGYVSAIALAGLTLGYVAWRCDAAFIDQTRAAAAFARHSDESALAPEASVGSSVADAPRSPPVSTASGTPAAGSAPGSSGGARPERRTFVLASGARGEPADAGTGPGARDAETVAPEPRRRILDDRRREDGDAEAPPDAAPDAEPGPDAYAPVPLGGAPSARLEPRENTATSAPRASRSPGRAPRSGSRWRSTSPRSTGR